MRKIGKGLILTALFAVCTVGMVGVNLNAATLQNKDQKSYDIEIMTDGRSRAQTVRRQKRQQQKNRQRKLQRMAG